MFWSTGLKGLRQNQDRKSFDKVGLSMGSISDSLHLEYLIKGSIFLKNRHFIIQDGLNELVFGISAIIKCGIRQPVKFQLVSRFRTGSTRVVRRQRSSPDRHTFENLNIVLTRTPTDAETLC